MNGESDKDLIVVGVDSSAGAKEALHFALGEAKLRQATLRVVHAWQFGYIGVAGMEGFSPVVPQSNGIEIERHVVEGAPATVLVDESRHADLLVVGSRGHGGFAGLLLGSVSQQCAQHAACPVVIVRQAD